MNQELDLRSRTKPAYYWDQLPYELREEWFTILKDEFDSNEIVDDLIDRENTPKTVSEWEKWVYAQNVEL